MFLSLLFRVSRPFLAFCPTLFAVPHPVLPSTNSAEKWYWCHLRPRLRLAAHPFHRLLDQPRWLHHTQALDHLHRWTHRSSALHFHDGLCFHIGEKYPSKAYSRGRIRYLRWLLARLAQTNPHPKASLAKHLVGASLDVAAHPQARLFSLVLPSSGLKLTARERNL